MRRKRVTGRFYIFLLAIVVIAFLIVRPHLDFGAREITIEPGSASYSRSTDAVIIRDGTVFSSGTIARVEYVAMENTLLNEGDTIAYDAGAAEKQNASDSGGHGGGNGGPGGRGPGGGF